MANRARISVEDTEEATVDRAVCIVRCLEGVVSPGDMFDVATSTGGEDARVALYVTRIWRYGRPIDLLGPPHSAKVELTGQGTLSLPGVTHLTMTTGA
ncbi:hypothetical protein C8250_039390 [Streptomyces sp. So13.3]|uniref:hypothetical protein n=1 Tax=Streptomyces TaxID=1883 RepID=UPI001105D95D|nr:MULTISPECIES: hypothetical protein [Streptomyces]QNA77117.1 hypothetical protein C8250_039390 [Streptomyces sp. So13.3]